MQALQSGVRLIALSAIAWLSSEYRANRPWRITPTRVGLAFILAVAFLKLRPPQTAR